MIGGSIIYGVFFFAFLGRVDSGILILAILGNIPMSVFMAMPQGVIPAFLGEQFSKVEVGSRGVCTRAERCARSGRLRRRR